MPVVTLHVGERLLQIGRHPKLDDWLWDSLQQRPGCNRVVFFMFKKAFDVPYESFFEEAKHSAPSLDAIGAILDVYADFLASAATPFADIGGFQSAMTQEGATGCPAIRVVAESRGISRLVHFTRRENLASILEHGLLSRRALAEKGLTAVCNDALRLDGDLDGISLSIEWHNYKMLYSICAGRFDHWALIAIKPDVLWTHDCRFFPKNAASGDVDKATAYLRANARALEELYGSGHSPPRRSPFVGKSMPTNPQAEVMCRAGLQTDSFLEVALSQPSPALEHMLAMRSVLCKVDRFAFGPRIDYAAW